VNLLRASCRPLPGTDPARTGFGLPDAPAALALTTLTWPTAMGSTAGAAVPDFAHLA
jgi:hypothetical protein